MSEKQTPQPPENNLAASMIVLGEAHRSQELQRSRSELVQTVAKFTESIKELEARKMPLRNGMQIQQGAGTTKTVFGRNGTTHKVQAEHHPGAYVENKGGITTVEINTPNSSLHIKYDILESMHGSFNQQSNQPHVTASIRETLVSDEGTEHYFGMSVLTDGSVVSEAYNEATQIHAQEPANLANISDITQVMEAIQAEFIPELAQ